MARPEFGITLRGSTSAADFRDLVERVEGLGFATLAAPDHLGAPDPFAVLAAAAQATDRVRLRTYVLNAGFWNPALLARAAATVDLLSGGRLELGLGAGHMRSEHEDAGLPWHAHPERVEGMERTIADVHERLRDPGHEPRPVQDPIPIAVGAMGPAALRVAARHADIVAFSGLLQAPGAPPGTFVLASAAQTRERVAEVRALAGSRAPRADALLQVVRLGADPEGAAAALAAEWGDVTAAELLDTPFVLLARDAEQGAEILTRRRQEFGFDSFTTHQANLDPLARVLAAAR